MQLTRAQFQILHRLRHQPGDNKHFGFTGGKSRKPYYQPQLLDPDLDFYIYLKQENN